MTPRPTDSTGEFENLSDEAEELCYSSFFSDLCNTHLELAAVMPGKCCLNKIEPYIVEFFLSSLTLPICVSSLPQLRCRQNKKTLETVQWVMVRKLARVANSMAFLVVKFVRLKMKPQLGGTRGCSPVQRERGLIKSS